MTSLAMMWGSIIVERVREGWTAAGLRFDFERTFEDPREEWAYMKERVEEIYRGSQMTSVCRPISLPLWFCSTYFDVEIDEYTNVDGREFDDDHALSVIALQPPGNPSLNMSVAAFVDGLPPGHAVDRFIYTPIEADPYQVASLALVGWGAGEKDPRQMHFAPSDLTHLPRLASDEPGRRFRKAGWISSDLTLIRDDTIDQWRLALR